MKDGFLHFTGGDRILLGWGKVHSFARPWGEVGFGWNQFKYLTYFFCGQG